MVHSVLLFCAEYKERDVQAVKITHWLSEESQWRQCKQLLPDALHITWHLTQQLLAKAGALFTHHYTSAVHKHRRTHSAMPTKKITGSRLYLCVDYAL